MKKTVKKIASTFNLGITSSVRLAQLEAIESDCYELFELAVLAGGDLTNCKSQLKQDLFVLLESRFKRNGFFVEFGATNGIDLSNTYLLEKSYGWTGILAEPATIWKEDLIKNRNAALEFNCVWSKTGEKLSFNMVEEAEFSTINNYSSSDAHALKRKKGSTYEVKTISLLDMLIRHNSPAIIDYLSIDTEGSEYEILKNFDFSKYDIKIITCEHNFTADRSKLLNLLTSNGYQRKFTGLSKWDDWYVKV